MSREETLFQQAAAISSDKLRREVLEQACGEDATLRRSIEKRLDQLSATGDFSFAEQARFLIRTGHPATRGEVFASRPGNQHR